MALLRALLKNAQAYSSSGLSCSGSSMLQMPWHHLTTCTRMVADQASTTPVSMPSTRALSTAVANETSTRGFSSTVASEASPATSQAPDSPPSTSESTAFQIPEELMQCLLQPISKGSKYNGVLSPYMMSIDNRWFLDPAVTLQSTMRALYVIKQMLRQDAQVLIVNSNPLMKPLMEEAARCCTNSNVWFYSEKWVPGTLTNHKFTRSLFKDNQQPNRKLFASRGLKMTNPHCPEGDPADISKVKLSYQDKMRLFDHSRRNLNTSALAERLLVRMVECERHLSRMEVPGTLTGRIGGVRLMVVLDPTYNSLALQEAQHKNIFSIGLVNHHKDLSAITYPVFARDNHPMFQHFLLNWILKVVNVR